MYYIEGEIDDTALTLYGEERKDVETHSKPAQLFANKFLLCTSLENPVQAGALKMAFIQVISRK